MEALPCLLVTVLALCLMPSASAIKCYECVKLPFPVPGFSGGECSSDTDKLKTIDCEAIYDRCMTLTGTIKSPDVSVDFELRNCSNSLVCNPDSPLSVCNILNTTTGVFSKCNTNCCEGDLCNGAVRISGLVAGFTAILFAVVLNLFPGFY